jgi:hypothetical protein
MQEKKRKKSRLNHFQSCQYSSQEISGYVSSSHQETVGLKQVQEVKKTIDSKNRFSNLIENNA